MTNAITVCAQGNYQPKSEFCLMNDAFQGVTRTRSGSSGWTRVSRGSTS